MLPACVAVTVWMDWWVHGEDLSTMSVVAEVPSMEMEEMDGRCARGMSPRSWNSASRQELAQPAAPPPTCLATPIKVGCNA